MTNDEQQLIVTVPLLQATFGYFLVVRDVIETNHVVVIWFHCCLLGSLCLPNTRICPGLLVEPLPVALKCLAPAMELLCRVQSPRVVIVMNTLHHWKSSTDTLARSTALPLGALLTYLDLDVKV